ncbi:MAG TPA: glycosyltransferase family 4 protein [Opitutaceae bacterium]|nr:glycosyltransferase family 4 protein [Opitutaceae bacterium]
MLYFVSVLLRRFGVVDKPNARSSHDIPTVRGGGIVLVLVILVMMLWLAAGHQSYLVGLAVIFFGLAAISFWDDLRSLSPTFRFGAQVIAVASALLWLKIIVPSDGTMAAADHIVFFVISFVWMLGYMNAFNFMDGINGLAGGQALVTALGTAILAHLAGLSWTHPALFLALVVAAASAGLLPHNFPRAKVFMGDVGSVSLGFLLAVITVWIACDTSWWLLPWLGLLHANFVLDTGITMVRRVALGERWYEAHREHFYQRLIRAGQSHQKVTLSEMALQGVVMVLLIAVQPTNWTGRIMAVVTVLLLWSGFFLYAEYTFRHACLGRMIKSTPDPRKAPL